MGTEKKSAPGLQPQAAPGTTARLALVIVSYNTRKLIRRCLDSLRAFPPACDYEVIVVDNASRDGSAAMLQQEFPHVPVVLNRHNLGYAVAVNQGLEATNTEYVLILNPDIVLRQGCIDSLVDFMDAHPDAGLAGGKLINTDGTLQYSCRSFYTPKTLIMRRTILGRLFPRSQTIRKHLMLDYDHREPRAVDWVIGACMMVRRRAVEAVGGMDERFFLYFEDVDWCFRMGRQGWRVYYVPQAEMVHEHRRESAKPRFSRSFWAHLGSLLRFYEKWNRYAYGIKRYREVLKTSIFVASDLLAINLAFLAAYMLRVTFAHYFANPLYTLENYHNFWIFTNIVAFVALVFSGQYRIGRMRSAADELFDLGRALSVVVVIMAASTYITHERLISRAVVAFFFVLAPLTVWAFRRILRGLHRRVLEMRLDLRRLLIVGTRTEARSLRSRLALRPELGLDVVGWVDAESASDHALGTLQDLPDVVREHRIQEVLVAPSAAHVEGVARMVLELRRRAVDVTVVSGFAEILTHRARIGRVADVPVMRFERDTLYTLQALAKRGVDICGALLLLVVGAPAAVLYSLLAKARGLPLIRREVRLGLDASPLDFPLLQNQLGLPPSDLVNWPAWLAVLRGRLSLVGPYPLEPEWEQELQKWQRIRFDMRPGVFGFWRGLRPEEVDLDAVVRLDLYYVQNWSLGLDFRVALQSLGQVLRGRMPRLRADSGDAPPEEAGS
ncbi:MAG: glycosyltransferase [Candidatus Latescibacterota bacterium]|nr:MAG: glycosyltransferase [Candidatus Latescibacterota bacterium]